MTGKLKNVTVEQVSDALGVTVQGVHKKAKSEGWKIEKEKKATGGYRHTYKRSTLPPEVQVALSRRSKSLDLQPAENLPTAGQGSCAVRPSLMGAQDRLPGWAEKIAHARADLIHHYITARQQSKIRKTKTTTAVKQFLEAYNAGIAWPLLFETLGTVSRSTIDRWRKDLEENEFDYRILAPGWGKHRNGRSKLTQWESDLLFSQIFHQNRIKVGTAIKVTKYILQQKGIYSPSSPATMRRAIEIFQKQHFDLWTFYREGEKAALDKVLPFIERDDTLLDVGDVLVADGHRCSFFVNHPFTGKRCRPMLVGFFDWKSRILCGWALALEENSQVIAAALRSAILRLGKIPKIAYTDNGKAFKSKIFLGDIDLEQSGLLGMFARLDIKAVFAKPYNARAKVIERFFRDFGNQFERYLPSYCGASIPDKPASLMRNEKLMKAFYGENILEIQQVQNALEKWFDFHGATNHPTIKGKLKREVFEAGRGPGVDQRNLDFLMMDSAVKRIGRNGIQFLSANYFDESLYGLREQVVVRYDLNDISSILVYAKSGEYLCRAERVKRVHPMAAHLGEPKDLAELKHQTSRNASLKKGTTRLAREALESSGNIAPLKALPWNRIEDSAPGIIQKVAAMEAEHEGEKTAQHARQITAEGPIMEGPIMEDSPPLDTETLEPEKIVPIFSTEVEVYDHLVNKQSLTPDDQEWLDEFYQTETGQSLKAMEIPKTGTQGESQ